MDTTPYYSIYALLSVKWSLMGRRKQLKRKFQTFSSKSGRGHLWEVENWLLIRGGLLQSEVQLCTVFTILIELHCIYPATYSTGGPDVEYDYNNILAIYKKITLNAMCRK